MQKIRKQIAELWGVPLSSVMNVPVLTTQGNCSMYIENYKSISRYTDTELSVIAKDMSISVCGRGLNIDIITSDMLVISGFFQKIEYKEQKEVKNV